MLVRGVRLLLIVACLLLLSAAAPSALADDQHAGDACVLQDPLAEDSEDAGSSPAHALEMGLLGACEGHLLIRTDESDVLVDSLVVPAGFHVSYEVGVSNEATMAFRLLWIDATSLTVLDEVTLKHDSTAPWETAVLSGQVPAQTDATGRAYVEILLIDTPDLSPMHGDDWTVYRQNLPTL